MLTILRDVDVKNFTTFRISSKASAVAIYENLSDLFSILNDSSLPKPLKPIGSGSNLLFVGDFPGTLLLSNDLNIEVEYGEPGFIYLTAGAGIDMDSIIEYTASQGLWGLENLSGIPGKVGASVVQNVGAYGVEAGDVTINVSVYDTAKNCVIEINKSDLEFGYRTSMFKKPENKSRYVVLSVTFKLSKNPQPIINYGDLKARLSQYNENISPLLVRSEIINIRNSKLPSVDVYGSAGSFFKNPVIDMTKFEELKERTKITDIPFHKSSDDLIKIPAAWLIEKSGLKGKTCGGAQIWPNQPLVIINKTGNATSEDVLELCENIIETVKSKFDIELSPEVEIIGAHC